MLRTIAMEYAELRDKNVLKMLYLGKCRFAVATVDFVNGVGNLTLKVTEDLEMLRLAELRK